MSMEQFENQKYLTIETFRRNGTGVKTPVWFARDGSRLHIWTFAGSGKTKRIRRDGTVRIAPSTASGQPLGEWVSAHAIADKSPQAVQHVQALMKKKYGFAFMVFSLLGKIRKAQPDTIKVLMN